MLPDTEFHFSGEDHSRLLAINGGRLWDSLMTMATIGATAGGGCNRQALSDLDKQARDLFVAWARAAGCTVRVDEMGNLFARRAGVNDSLPPVMTGSHLDTQPSGGRFDGVYGVLAGLEVVRTLEERQLRTLAPLEICVWTNEEGARFSPAMIGSGVWSGEFDRDYGHSRSDAQGITIADALASIGYLGDTPCRPFPARAFLEAHIEQGPILENEGAQIGIVEGVQGIRWYDLVLRGTTAHAGPTPMNARLDPFTGLHPIIHDLFAMAESFGPDARVTLGDVQASPGARNTVPRELVLAVDLRHPEQSSLEAMDRELKTITSEHCDELGLEWSINEEWHSPAVAFHSLCTRVIATVAKTFGYRHRHMVSGAGHDAVYLSRKVPTGMIFVPCANGISHNEAEYAAPEDLEAGCNVLLHSMLQLSGSAG